MKCSVEFSMEFQGIVESNSKSICFVKYIVVVRPVGTKILEASICLLGFIDFLYIFLDKS